MDGPVHAETACALGALINSILFSIWTAAYTVPRWKTEIADYAKPGENLYVIIGYVLYGVLVGVHSLSFWKSVNKLGTVSVAVSKGAQQAGVFIVSTLFIAVWTETSACFTTMAIHCGIKCKSQSQRCCA